MRVHIAVLDLADRVQNYSDLLVSALRREQADAAVLYARLAGHYANTLIDLAQPWRVQ